eukprot:TRINITY_DN654427_c0_g1_i1.p1 TRINITY_DN654427_c0_g1~~TRINITY_DN654427_c0_g1_i1.p1  ORF type:complete len:123 (-),score=20.12 TRINITY_DN654427_c0_g1_i1:1-369(-)
MFKRKSNQKKKDQIEKDQLSVNQIKESLKSFATSTCIDIKNGEKSQNAASLLFEKFGYGMAEACVIFLSTIEAQEIYDYVDQLVIDINPDHKILKAQIFDGLKMDFLLKINEKSSHAEAIAS